VSDYCGFAIQEITFFCIANLRPEMRSVATNFMPEVVSDLSYDIKKMLESCPQEL
jgi:hypothetical protein